MLMGGENVKKLSEGKYEILTTKDDAIDKFMQMQGICREELSNEKAIEFKCFKDGKIFISNLPTRHIENDNATDLFAQVVEQNGKTYVTYYTNFNKSVIVWKFIFIILDILLGLFAILLSFVYPNEKSVYLIPFGFICTVLLICRLISASKEEKHAPKDSAILIHELEKRVQAVNLWDK